MCRRDTGVLSCNSLGDQRLRLKEQQQQVPEEVGRHIARTGRWVWICCKNGKGGPVVEVQSSKEWDTAGQPGAAHAGPCRPENVPTCIGSTPLRSVCSNFCPFLKNGVIFLLLSHMRFIQLLWSEARCLFSLMWSLSGSLIIQLLILSASLEIPKTRMSYLVPCMFHVPRNLFSVFSTLSPLCARFLSNCSSSLQALNPFCYFILFRFFFRCIVPISLFFLPIK